MIAHALSCYNPDPECLRGVSDISPDFIGPTFLFLFVVFALVFFSAILLFYKKIKGRWFWLAMLLYSLQYLLSLVFPEAFDIYGMTYCPSFCTEGPNYELKQSLLSQIHTTSLYSMYISYILVLVGLYRVLRRKLGGR